MTNYAKSVLVVSDLHVGSIYGLAPPGFKKSDGAMLDLNPGQRYLWDCWLTVCKFAGRIKPAAVVVNGDVIDGMQQAQRGTELSIPMLEDQSAAAATCLQALRRRTHGAKWFYISGTEYHDQKAAREVEVVARMVGGTPYNGLGAGRYCREVLDLNVDSVICNFAHHISVAGGLYRATPPDREAVWSALAGKEGKAPRADICVRSHAHHYVHVEHPSKHAVVTPCWQLQTRYMRKHSVYRMMPDIGAIVLWIDPAAKGKGDDPVRVQKILFPLPRPEPTKL